MFELTLPKASCYKPTLLVVGFFRNPSEKYANVKMASSSPMFQGKKWQKCLMFHHLAQGSWYNLAKFLPKKSLARVFKGGGPSLNVTYILGYPSLRGQGSQERIHWSPRTKKPRYHERLARRLNTWALKKGEMEMGVSTNSSWGWMSQECSKWLVNGLQPTYKWDRLGL